MTPLFVLSLPRSGSTLLQRLLVTHPAIATTAEPWLLLPLLYARRPVGVEVAYQHEVAAQALNEFVERLPRGSEDFNTAVRAYAGSLYDAAAPAGTRYFLDKTPRYSLVAQELIDVFPDARYVFLWRNPLAVVASIAKTWGHGRWLIHRYEPDLRIGLPNLVEARRRLGERAVALRYEDLAADPQRATSPVFEYLNLDGIEDVSSKLHGVELRGLMGDQTRRESTEVSKTPLRASLSVFDTPIRRAWAKRYLSSLGEDCLGHMGYDLDELLGDLASEKVTALPASVRDLLALGRSWAHRRLARLLLWRQERASAALRGEAEDRRRPMSAE